jgi:hypothetical protein
MPGHSSWVVDPGRRRHNGGGSGRSPLWVPEHLRSDNGPEFIAYCIQDWLTAQEIKTLYIKPGSPWENGHIESFHDKLRDECLNANSSAFCTRRALSWKAGVSNTMNVVRTARLATGSRTSMPGERRTNLMGAARSQAPRRSPRQVFGGNSQATPQSGKQTKPKTLTNPQNFSYEVSPLRGQASLRKNITEPLATLNAMNNG